MSSSNSYHHHHSDNSPTSSYNDSIHSNHSTPIHLMKRNRFISKQQFYSVETDIIHCICMTIVNQMNEAELDGYYPSQAYDLFNKEKTSYSFGPLVCIVTYYKILTSNTYVCIIGMLFGYCGIYIYEYS